MGDAAPFFNDDSASCELLTYHTVDKCVVNRTEKCPLCR